MGDWILAAALLAGGTSPDPGAPQESFAALRGPLIRLALDWEILDARELKMGVILKKPQELDNDLRLLRFRLDGLRDAPPLSDANCFPGPEISGRMRTFNKEYRKWLDGQLAMASSPSNARELKAAQEETDALFKVWDEVHNAHMDCYYVSARRFVLKRLRDLLGDDAYYRRQLPCCVPLRRFREHSQWAPPCPAAPRRP